MQLKQICNHPVQYLHQTGKTTAEVALDHRSGKLERLGELLEEVLAAGDRALIFTQFAEMGTLLANYLPKAFGAAHTVFTRRHVCKSPRPDGKAFSRGCDMPHQCLSCRSRQVEPG